MKRIIWATCLALQGVTTVAMAAWPDRPITVVVPAAAGGTTDIAARDLGTSIAVENKGGGGGSIGTSLGADREGGWVIA